MKNKKGLIVTFIHSNYCYTTGGTEKFERDYSSLLQQAGYDNLVFFSMFVKVGKTRYVGAILNEKFIGVYEYKKIKSLIIYIAIKLNINLHSFSIQHLKNHDYHYIVELINELRVPVNFFVHDYYFLCINTRMIHSNGIPCGLNPPNNKKCSDCSYYKENTINHFADVKCFFKDIQDYLYKIIVPSEFVKECFEKTFPSLKDYIFVRTHQILSGTEEYKIKGFPIKLAYVGAQIDDKGYLEWLNLVEQLKDNPDFDLYYFGSGEDVRTYVTNVNVVQNTSKQRKMEDYLKEYNIDCAFFWSHCAETYSYVYYELSLAGVFVVTNEISGNVTSEVRKNKNGKIFKSVEDCYGWFKTSSNVIEDINEYIMNGSFKPNASEVNDDLMLISGCCSNITYNSAQKPPKNTVMSLLYLFKHRRMDIKLLDRNGESK